MTFEEIYRDYPEHRQELDERSAIKEFHGNIERVDAEEQTAELMQKKHLLFVQGTLFNGGRYEYK